MPYPMKPVIRKLGTIACDIVEATPLVFRNELYRFEYIRPSVRNVKNTLGTSYFQLVNVRNGALSAPFAFDHHLGCAYVDQDTVYSVGCAGRWDSDTLHFYRSTDLQNWEQYAELHMPGWGINNTGICRMGDVYTLLIEISAPEEEVGRAKYTFRFLQSTDLTHWTLTPHECAFQRDRYAGGPAIYTVPDDPHYYVGYLEAYPTGKFANCLARSTDLIHWEYSPFNPLLMYDDAEDKKIASPFLTPDERERIRGALDVNNSDMEMCEYLGRTILYYSWGDQHGTEFLAEAAYEGSMRDLLQGFFPEVGEVKHGRYLSEALTGSV